MLAHPKEQSLICVQGFRVGASNGLDMVARLSRGDVNMPDFDGFPIHEQAEEAAFEAGVYNLLRRVRNIRASCLLHHRCSYAQILDARNGIQNTCHHSERRRHDRLGV